MQCRRILRKNFVVKAISLLSVILLLVHVYLITFFLDANPKTNPYQFLQHTNNDSVRYIFNMPQWHIFVKRDQILRSIDPASWCDIPVQLTGLAKGFCRIYNIPSCSRLPCQMIYSLAGTIEEIPCQDGGRVMRNAHSTVNKPDFVCKLGYALDLFVNNSSEMSYPSMIADSYAPLVDEFYTGVLNRLYRSPNSMWGLIFNFESISNYPTAADPQKLKVFNVTFGYDRSIYDFVPGPWLFNYVEQIKSTPQRLSVQQVINRKKSIQSSSSSDTYWTNMPTNSINRNDTMESSYVRSPILWMNSNCQTKTQRTQYMRKLMQSIDVDNFGTCGTDIRPLPEHIVKLQRSANRNLQDRATYDWEAGKLALTSDHLFTIAIENSRNHDYVTEKLWHAFAAGSVPIYLGAPNIEDWLPCRTTCIIDLSQFETPEAVALHIKNVAKNRTLYESYHQWRNEPVSDKFQKMLDYFAAMRNYSLECILCDMSRRFDHGEDVRETKRKIIETVGRF